MHTTPPTPSPALLTPEQIKNWREILFLTVGPYAFLATDEDIQRMKDNMQANLNKTKS